MKFFASALGLIILFILVLVLGPLITKIAWSYSMTPVFGIREISWVEALAFNVLGTIFGGYRPSKKSST